jgi:hypothetical protein
MLRFIFMKYTPVSKMIPATMLWVVTVSFKTNHPKNMATTGLTYVLVATISGLTVLSK